MHFYTSVAQNYLPKARVLAKSVRKYCKDSYFSLVISDNLPDNFDLSQEPFDEVVHITELGIPVENLNNWIFIHRVVEICTAVKGQALLNFLQAGHSNKVVYLDPDTAVFDDLTELEGLLDEHSIVLTPHITIPEEGEQAIWDNEICALKHGVNNLGFVAVRNSEDGLAFAKFWRDRLLHFCYDDIPNGIFTDQRWVDLAVGYFDGVHVLRKPNYNVATWNISHRQVEEKDGRFYVNGLPLQFYHFSGFDSGAQESMLARYGKDNPALYKLREWYIVQQDENGQQELGKKPITYAFYSNGEKIPDGARLMMRNDKTVQAQFGQEDPFDANGAYYAWSKAALQTSPFAGESNSDLRYLKEENAALRASLNKYHKLLAPALAVYRLLKGKKA